MAKFALSTTLFLILLVATMMTAHAAGNAVKPVSDIPVNIEGTPSDPEMWRYLRRGGAGRSTVRDKKVQTLIQSSGEEWRAFRVERLPRYGTWALAGVCTLLIAFFMVRGRIRIETGFAKNSILRFGSVDRFAHWLLALSFLVLAVTGLNILYGSDVIMPLIGHTRFAKVAGYGKWLHDFTGFSFIAGLVLVLVLWVRDNIPERTDLIWLRGAGGLLPRAEHPPARRFNAGQKIIFWFVVLAGASVSFSGICLIFPFNFAPFGGTFAVLNWLGAGLQTDLSPVQEMQLTLTWHGVLGIIMIAVIIAHIYLGSIGMEGAIDAMSTGHVDENWARQHHSLWAADQTISKRNGKSDSPADAANLVSVKNNSPFRQNGRGTP
jgi:formate dehydrogenase subunit gamma